MKSIPASEIPNYFHGNLGVLTSEQGVRPFRLRNKDIPWLFEMLRARAELASGTRLSFQTNTRRISLKGEFLATTDAAEGLREQRFDLAVDGQVIESLRPQIDGVHTITFQELPAGDKLVEIWLPQGTPFFLQELILEKDSDTIQPFNDTRPRWITYGSSITQCSGAASPSQTWPAIVARHFNWNLTSLGFGGQCHFDQIVARAIADQPADRISLCLGINTLFGSLSPRTWQGALEGFIFTVRDKHPNTPLLLISPIAATKYEHDTADITFIGMTWMRKTIEASYQKFVAAGDKNIYYMSGLELINTVEACEHLLPDLVHPTPKGYQFMGKRFIEKAPKAWVG